MAFAMAGAMMAFVTGYQSRKRIPDPFPHVSPHNVHKTPVRSPPLPDYGCRPRPEALWPLLISSGVTVNQHPSWFAILP
jgi:hypothetical protein